MSSIPNIPDTIAREIYAELCRSLPPLPDDVPERRAIRDEHAMISVAHLLPATAAEANVAAQNVAAQFHARDALQAASRAGIDSDELRRCRVQAASMMRQADSGIRSLLRMQTQREKAEDAARPAAMERAGIGSTVRQVISICYLATTGLFPDQSSDTESSANAEIFAIPLGTRGCSVGAPVRR